MNIFKSLTMLSAAFVLLLSSCGDKTTPVLVEQAERLNLELQAMATENPALLSSANASFAENQLTVDVKLADSLFIVSLISEPLFNYFTACEVKSHLDKNLETTVNALTEKKANLVVNLTDVYGESSTYTLTPAALRRMVKSPLTQLDFSEARKALITCLDASAEQFRPAVEGPVKGISTSFAKGGYFDIVVEFNTPRPYNPLTSANIKARALKVFEKRYANLGPVRPVLFSMYKSLGIDGFHLIYTAGPDSRTLKTTISLANIH